MIPKYDIQVSVGFDAYNSNEPAGQISLDRVFIERELRASYRHLSSLTVVGDSMEPTLRNNDVIIIDNNPQDISLHENIKILGRVVCCLRKI